MISFSVVEAVMADIFRVEQNARGALRSRMRHLQRLGISEGSPGSGRHLSYSREYVINMGMALSLAEIGLDPKVIASMVTRMSDLLSAADYLQPVEDRYLLHFPTVFSRVDSTAGEVKILRADEMASFVHALPRGSFINIGSLVKMVGDALKKLGA